MTLCRFRNSLEFLSVCSVPVEVIEHEVKGEPCRLLHVLTLSAAAALAAVSTVVVTPVVARQVPLAVRQMETKLVDVGIDNIPINLFDDILNIPSNELSGINVFGDSLIFSGDWWVPSATNIWGTDPGDLGHYMGLVDMAIPLRRFPGLDQPEIDPTAAANGTLGLAQQLGLLAAAELPVSASCDAQPATR